MPDKVHSNRKRETLIRLPIGKLAVWRLMVTCDHCRAERAVTVRDLVARFGPEQRLVFLVARLRCKEPRGRRQPDRVRLRSKLPALPGPEAVEIVLTGLLQNRAGHVLALTRHKTRALSQLKRLGEYPDRVCQPVWPEPPSKSVESDERILREDMSSRPVRFGRQKGRGAHSNYRRPFDRHCR